MFSKCYNCFNPYHRYPIMPQFNFPESMYTDAQPQNSTQMQPQQQSQGNIPMQPEQKTPPSDFETLPGSPITLDTQYTQGYLKTQIGKKVKIVFLLGANLVQDRTGTLLDVGISYVLLKDFESPSNILCDIYSIKFVNIYQ